MSKPTLEDLQRIWRTNYGNDYGAIQEVLRMIEPLETQERCEERVRDAVKFGMRITYSWACNETDTGPEAFERFVEHHTKRQHPQSPDGSSNPEPTPDAVAAFNARQLEFRRIYLLGYAEVLPEHRAEGVVKAAERFPLKRLVTSPTDAHLAAIRASKARMRRMELDGRTIVDLSKVEWMDRADLLAALALLDAAPRVEDVPLEEEEDA